MADRIPIENIYDGDNNQIYPVTSLDAIVDFTTSFNPATFSLVTSSDLNTVLNKYITKNDALSAHEILGTKIDTEIADLSEAIDTISTAVQTNVNSISTINAVLNNYCTNVYANSLSQNIADVASNLANNYLTTTAVRAEIIAAASGVSIDVEGLATDADLNGALQTLTASYLPSNYVSQTMLTETLSTISANITTATTGLLTEETASWTYVANDNIVNDYLQHYVPTDDLTAFYFNKTETLSQIVGYVEDYAEINEDHSQESVLSTIYLDTQSVSDTPDGSSSDPFKTLTEAIAYAKKMKKVNVQFQFMRSATYDFEFDELTNVNYEFSSGGREGININFIPKKANSNAVYITNSSLTFDRVAILFKGKTYDQNESYTIQCDNSRLSLYQTSMPHILNLTGTSLRTAGTCTFQAVQAVDTTLSFGDDIGDSTSFVNYCIVQPIACVCEHSTMTNQVAFTFSGAVGYSKYLSVKNSTVYTTSQIYDDYINRSYIDRYGSNLFITTNFVIRQS